MRYRLGSIQVRHEARFRAPFFPIADSRVELLRQLHRSLGERYAARPADLHFTAIGAALSDLRATVSLFRGNGMVEVTAEKVTASFSNALESDIQIITDCVKRGLIAVESFSETEELFSDEFVSASFVLLLNDPVQRDGILSGFPLPFGGKSIDLAPEVRPVFKVELRDPSKDWTILVELSRAWAHETGIFMVVTANFLRGGGSESVEARVKLMNDLCLSVLRALGLEPETQG